MPKVYLQSLKLIKYCLYTGILLFYCGHLHAQKITGIKQLSKLEANKITENKLHVNELEIVQLNEFQTRVQERVNEIKAQGYGGALLLRPFSKTYRLYKFDLVDGFAVQGDIILGPLRQVVKASITNRDAGYQIGDPASKPIAGAVLSPPIIPDAAFLWKNGVIPYEIDTTGFTNGHITTINSGIAALDSSTNLTLRERYDNEKAYVKIIANQNISGNGLSAVGRQGDDQELFLNTAYENRFTERTVIHEMLHAAGFKHEQTRSDRDKHVRVLWKNITEGNEHNFIKDDARTYGTYDVKSIMHYSKDSFGKSCHVRDYANNNFCKHCSTQNEADFVRSPNGCIKYTLVSKTNATISPSASLTQTDIESVNAAYPITSVPKTGNKLPPINTSRTLALTIKELKTVAGKNGESGAVCGKEPDYIGEIVAGDVGEVDTGKKKPGLLLINDVKLTKTKKKDKEVGDTVNPNWKLNVPVGPNVKEVYLIIKIWEFDDALCGGKNDLVDVSPQSNQGFLRLLVDLETGELQHLKAQASTDAGGIIYYQRARQSGYSFFDSSKGEFQEVTFSGLEDGDATNYQMEASITLEGLIL